MAASSAEHACSSSVSFATMELVHFSSNLDCAAFMSVFASSILLGALLQARRTTPDELDTNASVSVSASCMLLRGRSHVGCTSHRSWTAPLPCHEMWLGAGCGWIWASDVADQTPTCRRHLVHWRMWLGAGSQECRQQFMWQPDLMRLAQFIDAGVRRMREIDPSDGSDIESARLAGTDVITCLVLQARQGRAPPACSPSPPPPGLGH